MPRVYVFPQVCPGSHKASGSLLGGAIRAAAVDLIVRDRGKVTARRAVVPDAVVDALAKLPDDVAADGLAQWHALCRTREPLPCGPDLIALDRPQVMGIINATPDSFSDGGRFGDPGTAAAHGREMMARGAAIIDVGGESTRPGATPMVPADECGRVVPVVERLVAAGAVVSIDTRHACVMEAALAAGAAIVNDVSALRHDPRSLQVVADAKVPVVLMHAPGDADDLHAGGAYADVVFDVFDALRDRRDAALAAGIAANRIVLDPGIGFGKSLSDNLALIAALPLFHALGVPLLVGASRKRMIGTLSRGAPADGRLGGSLALALKAADAGVQFLRVHDVAETVQALDVWCAVRDAAAISGGCPIPPA